MTSLPPTLTAKKILKDNNFGRQDILQFFSGVSKDYKYLKSPKHEIGTLKEVIVVIKRKRIQEEHDFSRSKQSTEHEMR